MSDSTGGGRFAAVVITLLVLVGGAVLTYLGLQPAAPPSGAGRADATIPAVPGSQALPTQAAGTSHPQAAGHPADPRVIDEIVAAVDAFEAQGEHERARVSLDAAVRSYPTEQSLRIRLARVLGSLNRVAESHDQYEKAIAIGPRSPVVEFEAGTMANAAGLSERALEHYSAAQAADPANADYPLYLGLIQRKLGQVDDAKASLMRSAKLRPDSPAVWASLADIALEENKPSVAKLHIDRARALDPKASAWRMIEARALNRLGKPDQALGVLSGISEAEKSNRAVVRLTGEALGMLGRVAEVAELFAKASDAAADDAESAMQAAAWNERAGNTTRAKVYANRAVMLGGMGAKELKDRLDLLP